MTDPSLESAFADGKAGGRALLMPFIVCGYPTDEDFVRIVRACAEAGADVLEIGIPFSDPIMDGPVIQAAASEVLARRPSTQAMLEVVRAAQEEAGIPFVLMTYYNLVFSFGSDAFAMAARTHGARGVILPDLSVEESAGWRKACAAAEVAPVFIASVTSPDIRLKAIGEASEGFVYAASQLGVTGVRTEMSSRARELVERIRSTSDLPVAVGIGVSTPEHAAEVASYADGVIVGSALVKRIGESTDPAAGARDLVAALRGGVDRAKR